jgi:hypothetical protein
MMLLSMFPLFCLFVGRADLGYRRTHAAGGGIFRCFAPPSFARVGKKKPVVRAAMFVVLWSGSDLL